MRYPSAVAALARQSLMTRREEFLRLIGVTNRANLAAGVHHGLCGIGFHGRGSIVAKLAECFGDQVRAGRDKRGG